jgi:hypothetical protein
MNQWSNGKMSGEVSVDRGRIFGVLLSSERQGAVRYGNPEIVGGGKYGTHKSMCCCAWFRPSSSRERLRAS